MGKAEKIITAVGVLLLLGVSGISFYRIHAGPPATPKAQLDADLRALGLALETYQGLSDAFPTQEQGLDVLVKKPTAEPVPQRWYQMMRTLPLDPWGEPYLYRYPPTKSHQKFDLYSKGPDRIAETPDDIGNWSGE